MVTCAPAHLLVQLGTVGETREQGINDFAHCLHALVRNRIRRMLGVRARDRDTRGFGSTERLHVVFIVCEPRESKTIESTNASSELFGPTRRRL
jgi:hypothetical protein